MKARKIRRLDPEAPLADAAERIIRVRLDELHSFVPQALHPAEAEALHDMRIAAKRLRYLLETTGDCFGAYAQKGGKAARELQDLLGEIHDCDVMLPRVLSRLEELRTADAAGLRADAGDSGDLDAAAAARAAHRGEYRGLETLVVWLRARRAVLFDGFLEMWEDLERRDFRRRLEAALADRPDPPVNDPKPAARRAGSLRDRLRERTLT